MPSKGADAGRAASNALGDRRATPDRTWLRALTGADDGSLRSILAETDAFVPWERAVRATHVAGGRTFYAQFRAPLELYALVRLLRPDHVIETGVSSGVSSMHLLLGLRKNRRGTLHSIDLPVEQAGAVLGRSESPVAVPPGRSSGWAIPEGLTDGWDLRLGRSEVELPRLVAELPSVGLFLHDSLHTPSHLTFELESVRPKLSEGAVVLADNTVWTGAAFPSFAREVGARVARRRRSDLVGLRYAPTVVTRRTARTTTPRRRRSRSSR